MDTSTQVDQAQHLQRLALDELELARRQLADAGQEIDGLRSDALALAQRVDASRAEAESFKERLEQEQEKNQALQPRIATLEAQVTRLRKQLERPGRLVAKKVLRRGPYGSQSAS